jgi:hypothetical protein
MCALGKTSRLVTHPEIALNQARLTSEFIAVELSEKKVYLGGMSILSILLSLEPGCHIDLNPIYHKEWCFSGGVVWCCLVCP